MSNYKGNRSNNHIMDFMLDAIEDRGYDPDMLDAAVKSWQEAYGEDNFWTRVLGPAIDKLESELGYYGLTKESEDEA